MISLPAEATKYFEVWLISQGACCSVSSLLVENCIAVGSQGQVNCSILIEEGKIVALLSPQDRPSAEVKIDARGRFVIPGGIDTHVHLGLGGQSFASDCLTESRSAVTGGITTFIQYLVDPAPGGSYIEIYDRYAAEVRKNSLIDTAFHIRIQGQKHVAEIPRYVNELHVTSFKFNLADPILPEGAEGYSGVDGALLLDGLRAIASRSGCIALVHSENREIVQRYVRKSGGRGANDLAAWCDSHPPFAEEESIASALFWAEMARAPLAIAHMTVGRGVELLGNHKLNYPFLYGETCPQYLMLNRDLPLGALGKCVPPVRTVEDMEMLWQGLAEGVIDFMGSDHCAYTAYSKSSDIWQAPSGLPGTGMILPILLSEGVNQGRITLERLVGVTSYNAARIFGFYPRKGNINVGADADLVILEMEKEVIVTPAILNSIVDYTPYEGYVCRGWPLLTIVGGRVVCEEGRIVDEAVRGHVLQHAMFVSSAEC